MEKKVTELVEYNIIENIIEKLKSNGMLQNLHGNCIAACDIISAMLLQDNIESTIVECQACISVTHNGKKYINLVGYDNKTFNGQIDTHVVVITKTKIPILIDASINQFLPHNHQVIVEKVDSGNPDILGNFDYTTHQVIYQIKKNIRLPALHQKSISDRILEDQTQSKMISKLKIVSNFLIGITILNLIANLVILFQ